MQAALLQDCLLLINLVTPPKAWNFAVLRRPKQKAFLYYMSGITTVAEIEN
jgi:hypothetical protein